MLFLCKISKIYINLHYVCDGKPDCYHSEDEKDCPLNSPLNNQFICENGKQTISFKHVCDFYPDCSDSSDERSCGKLL